jgi:hypothetical protein
MAPPLAAHEQRQAIPVIECLSGTFTSDADLAAAIRRMR